MVSIPNSKAQDSRSHEENFPGLWIAPSSETQGSQSRGRKGATKVFKHGRKSPYQASGQEGCVTILKTAVYGCVPDYSHPAYKLGFKLSIRTL